MPSLSNVCKSIAVVNIVRICKIFRNKSCPLAKSRGQITAFEIDYFTIEIFFNVDHGNRYRNISTCSCIRLVTGNRKQTPPFVTKQIFLKTAKLNK